MNIFVHVGSVKTGTSFIQRLLYINRSNLLENGIYYPIIHENYDNSNNDRWANGILLRDKDCISKLENEVNEFDLNSLVLSDEGLFSDFKNAIPDFFRGHNLRFLAYLRNPYELVSAWTSEMMKPYNLLYMAENKLDDFSSIDSLLIENAERYIYEFYGFLDSVDDVGPENVTIKPFSKNKTKPSGLAIEFLDAIGASYLTEENNESLLGITDFVNVTPTKSYSEISLYLFKSMKQRDILYMFDEGLVSSIYHELPNDNDMPLFHSAHDTLSRFEKEFQKAEKELSKRFDWEPSWSVKTIPHGDVSATKSDLNSLEIDRVLLKKLAALNASRIVGDPFHIGEFITDAQFLDLMQRAMKILDSEKSTISDQMFEFIRMSNRI